MSLAKWSALALLCAVCAVSAMFLWRATAASVSPPQSSIVGASEDPAVEGEGRVVGDSLVERRSVGSRTAPPWVVELLYGDADGVAGYFEAVATAAGDPEQRRVVSEAVLEELVIDNQGAGRLRNVTLPVALLTQDFQPNQEVVSVRTTYMAQTASSSAHQAMMRGLADWPMSSEAADRLVSLTKELLRATDASDLERIMGEMLRLGAIGGRVLMRTMVMEVARDQGRAMPMAFAFLDTGVAAEFLPQLAFDIAATQYAEGDERGGDTVTAFGVAFRTWMAGGLRASGVPEHAADVAQVLMRTATPDRVARAVGLGVTTAISLGGSTRDDPVAAEFLARASKTWPALAANTALVNLGFVTSPGEFLAYVPWPLDPPRDRERMVRHSDYLAGLCVALQRHPDQDGLVLPYVGEALRTWNGSSFEIVMCEHIMRMVKDMNMRGAIPALEQLRRGANSRLAAGAARILEEWK